MLNTGVLSLSAFNWTHPSALLSFARKENWRKFSVNCPLIFFPLFFIPLGCANGTAEAHKFIFSSKTWVSLIQPQSCEPKSFKDVLPQQQGRKSAFFWGGQVFTTLFVYAIKCWLKKPSEFYYVETRICFQAQQAFLKTMWTKAFSLKGCLVLERPKTNLFPNLQQIRDSWGPSYLYVYFHQVHQCLYVCLRSMIMMIATVIY